MLKRGFTLSLIIISGAVMGCGGTSDDMMSTNTEITDVKGQLEARDREMASMQQSMQQMQDELRRKEADLAAAKAGAASGSTQTTSAPATYGGSGELFPPNAKPNECYARVFVPEKYETKTEKVLKNDASERLEIVPAKFDWAEEKIAVKEASERLEVVPAKYGWVEERILVKPASSNLVEVPAQYETMTEKRLKTPAHMTWKKGRGPVERINDTTGEILCLIEVPATYETLSKRVLKSPATTREVAVPAEHKTVKRQVVKEPATVRKVAIPAEYQTIKVRKMTSPPQVKRIPIEPTYETVTSRLMVQESKMAWRTILCETNMSGKNVRDIQIALKNAGFNPGPIDGVIGSGTMAACRSYQKSKGLAVGEITHETLKSLGVAAR